MIPSPLHLPPKFTKISTAYSIKAIGAILSILLFFTLFCILIVASFYVAYWAITYPIYTVNKITILLKLGAIAGSAMLIAFVLKFIFNLRNHTPENRIKVSQEEEPELWKLILEICAETGAPKPKYIYLDPDVNAYVRYTNNILSLIMPVRKELTIGMPLFFGLNQSEFKAVMSHEFGHFAQRSMRIGSYIGTSNTIIHGMIYSNDSWDRTMQTWRNSDFRIAVFGWILSAVIFVLRLILKVFYFLLNILQGSLSREMEFNADKFAVSTTGSTPIVSALWKLDPLSETWNKWLQTAYHAKSKHVFTTNLFEYLRQDCEGNRIHLIEKEAALPNDSRGGKLYFQSSSMVKSGMYDSHPANDQREASAKTPFINCEQITDSSLQLLTDAEKRQTKLTRLIYKKYWNTLSPKEIDEEGFLAFIAEEKEVSGILDSYQNNFKDRFILIPDKNELAKALYEPIDSLENVFTNLRTSVAQLMEKIKEYEQQMQHAQHIYNGTAKEKVLVIDNVSFNKKNIGDAYKKLAQQREAHFESAFIPWDRQLFIALAHQAKKSDCFDQFIDRLDLHKQLIKLQRTLIGAQRSTVESFERLRKMGQVEQVDITNFKDRVNAEINVINEEIDALGSVPFSDLPNVESTKTLLGLIHPKQRFGTLSSNPFEDGSFQRLMEQLDGALFQIQRIEQGSLSRILKFEKSPNNSI